MSTNDCEFGSREQLMIADWRWSREQLMIADLAVSATDDRELGGGDNQSPWI